jgi:hypothetical protein
MQGNKTIIVLIVMITLLCVCLLMVGGIGLGLGFSSIFSSMATAPTKTPHPTLYQPPERPAPRGRLLLDDDFSQKRWHEYSDDKHNKGYADDHYFIAVDTQAFNYWSLAGETYRDFVLQVDTVHLDGPENNDYGVILRYRNDENFYGFSISSDGFYTFYKLVDNEIFEIIPWQQNEIIKTGAQDNTIRVEAVGPDFSFYINDKLVDTAIDSEFAEGDIGLIAGTYEEPGTHIAFDNLKVWAIE